jgi:hypothetical protein
MSPMLRNGMPVSPAEEAYRTVAERLLQRTDDSGPVPSILYHYTDAHGLLGILQTHDLWATNVLYLNDAKEVHYGHELGQDFINGFSTDSRIYRNLRRGLGYFASMTSQANVNNYVVSFCAKPDLLSQWRAYGHNGTGFAIGFDRAELAEMLDPGNTYQIFSLFPLVYGEGLQRELLSEFAAVMEKYCDESSTADLHWEDLRPWLNLILKCKHPLFREENEWRLSLVRLQPCGKPLYRVKDGNIVPYEKIKLRVKAVVSVQVGPTADPDIAERVVRDLLKYEGHAYATVVESSRVPLRM